MPVFVFDQSGLIEQRTDSEWRDVGREVHRHNKQSGAARKLLVGPQFPPEGQIFDTALGKLRPSTIQERVAIGEMQLPSGYRIESGAQGEAILSPDQKLDSSGDVIAKSEAELVTEGRLTMDAATQKIVDGQIVPKTRQELLSENQISYSQLRELEIKRIRAEVEAHFSDAKTSGGYRLDNLARQKAAFSMQYRALADTDPTKADLLSKQLIYPDTVTDEILAAAEAVQAAYGQAKAAIQTAFDQQKTVAEFEAIQLTNYL